MKVINGTVTEISVQQDKEVREKVRQRNAARAVIVTARQKVYRQSRVQQGKTKQGKARQGGLDRKDKV